MSEGPPPSYYVSSESNQRAIRPGQPPGRTVSQLQTNPTREWVKRNSPAQKFDSEKDNFFFSGTTVIKSVGKDEGLSGVRCMAVVNEKVWVGEREGCFSVWDFHTGDRLFRSTKKRDIFVWSVLGPVNGNLVWVGTSDSFVRVFNSDTMELVKEMKEHVGGVYCMADTPGARLVFTGSADFTIVKWDGPRMERICQFTGHSNSVRALIVVGKRLFSGSDDGTIKVWDIKTGALQASFEQHTGGVHALAFACGKWLWSASEDKTIRVWNPDDGSCVKIIDSPHTGQINCLTLIGSLMWSSSWNIAFVWDPETFEQKGQYKCHEGCINALLPVHQAVVSRVWSASNDGVINLWDTECTYRNAINAASDGRLEEALAQLEEAQNAVEAAKKRTLDMEQICVQLNAEKDRLNFAHNTAKEKHDQTTKDLRRQCQEANKRIFELKDKLEQAGASGDSDFDIPEVLAAYQKGLEPGSVMPAEYEDHPDLDPAERERRAKLREAFLKGKANAPLPGDDRPRGDALEARLKNALERAYRNGDTAGAERVRAWLDERFPKWRETAAEPIIPIDYLDDSKLNENDRDQKRRMRGEFVEGLVNGNIENVPQLPEGATDFEREQYRGLRDAFLRGKDAQRIFPGDVHNEGRKGAFARGLGNKHSPVPEEYADSDALDKDARKERAFQRSAFLRGRYAAALIPREFEDQQGLPTEERERRRNLREHFLYGLTCGPNAELPAEYQDQVSDLEAISQIRRESARNAFKQGQNAPSLIPEEYTETYSPDSPNVQSLRSELRDAFLMGMGHGEMPSTLTGHSEGFNRQLQDAYKKGWIASCPFEVQVTPSDDRSADMRRASVADELEKRKEMMDLLEKLEKENNFLKAENERLLREHKQTLDDLNKLREQVASFGVERSVRLDPSNLSPAELTMVKELMGDDADPELLASPNKVKVTGLGEVNLNDLTLEERERLMSVVARHRDEKDRENFRKEHGLISVGGKIVPELPALDEMNAGEQAVVVGINDKYKYQGGLEGAVNLPDWDEMTPEEVAFLKELMSKHRVISSSPTKSDQMPVANANTILSDAVATVMNEEMPDDVRRELASVLANETEQTTDAIRAAVNDSSLPDEIKQKLLDACDRVDELNAKTLETAIRRASGDENLPADIRRRFEEVLDSKDDQDGYVDRLQNAVRRASCVSTVNDDIKKDLRDATSEHDKQVANLYKQVLSVIHDAALSREQRLSLNERIAPPSRPHHVPEAVRELLASGTSLPDDVRAEFVRVLDGHDNRSNELATTVEEEGFEELAEAVHGPRNALPTAVRIKSMSQETPAEDRRALLRAYNVYQGRTAAAEDAARDALDNLTLPAESRRHLRSAIYRSGVSHADLLADAVRYAIAHDGTPEEVSDSLKGGLLAVQSRQGNLCAAVRDCLNDNDDLSEQTISDLEPALIACESRAAQLAAALSDICYKEEMNEEQKRALTSIARGCDNRVLSLEEAVATVAARDDVPELVCDSLQDALDTSNARGDHVWDAIDKNADVLRNEQAIFDDLDREDPKVVCYKIREVLADNEADLPARRVLHKALCEAVDKYALLREAARKESNNAEVPADARRMLRDAVVASDACADEMIADLRQELNDGTYKPATRHTLHSAIAETDSRYLTLADAARSQALSPDVPRDVQNALRDAVAEATGRTKELYHVARAAAHNPSVHADVRRVLREALGEDEVTALDVLRMQGLPAYQRRALSEALSENDNRAADLREAVKDVLDNCDLSDSMIEYLKDALEPVEESNQFLLDIVGTAEGEEGLTDDSRDKAKSANEQNISEVVRHLLQDAGIKPVTRANIADALAAHESSHAQLEDMVRNAIEKGNLPEDAVEKLNAALERKALQRKALQAIVNEAAHDPNMPLEARRLLADRTKDDVDRNMQIAKDVLETDLPEHQREIINNALKACNSRLQELLDSCKHVAATHDELDDEAKQALNDCEDVVDVHDVVDSGILSEDAESEVKKALAKYYGREADLANVLEEAAKDAAMSPESKAKLQKGNYEGEGIPNIEKALLNNDLSDDVRMVLEDALNEAQQEGPSVVQQGKDHQMQRLTVELEETLQGLKDELRKEKAEKENMSDENETLKLTVREYEQLIDNLGGYEEASRLAETSNSMRGLEDTIAEKEERLRELNEQLGGAADGSPQSRRRSSGGYRGSDANAADGGDAEGDEELDEADRIRKQRLRDAYQDGSKASLLTPLPEQYRQQDASDDEDAEFRKDLTHEWLRGRQDALGSVVPPEYASVTGLSDDDAMNRAAMRSAFLNGLQSGDGAYPEDETDDYIEAFKKGKALRDKELHQAGVEEGDEDGQVVRAFNSGINGEGNDEVDASLLASGMPVEDCQALCRVYNRGKWLRNDILGGEGLDSLDESHDPDRLDLLAGDRSRLAQLLNELDEWNKAADHKTMKGLGYPAPSPAYFRALQAALDEANQRLRDTEGVVREQQDRLKEKEKILDTEHKRNLTQLEKERALEVDKLKGLIHQMESDLSAKVNVHNSLHNRIERLTEQLGKSSAENEILTQELIKKAAIGDVTELVTYYKERERKWNELSQLNRELQVENKTLLTESTALAHKLRALSFVFESRPTLVRSLYELYKLLSHIPQTLAAFAKEAKKRQLPRLEILDEIREVNSEVDTCKDGTRWIIANLFTSYELQHLGTSPQFFIPDGRRLTWRDIQVPTKQRELLLSTWYGDEEPARTSPQRNASPQTHASRAQTKKR
eukprot:TRINITY_DN2028_c0_g1_i1.p1 TRINITY_DN2028_c0_g1~~TRINITY_DN2028_c0_g1_i1.p1  ORF type:complete len:2745 (+),score=1120.70 TRINITY_DN2028_c0_g1_i1:91-8325(+)